MNVFISDTGYKAKETLGGIDIYDSEDNFVCELAGLTLSRFEDEDGNISSEQLESEITSVLDAQSFIDYQTEYC
jgi:hypothetical protein